ncbi:MAG: tryptophan-rich sensory protein [Bryobacterales bacterium]|nr:tryptophan-rich sensory protein [Bryobacterales bacterium]
MMRSLVVLVSLLVLCLGAGYLGSLATSESVHDWYPTLAKPRWTPPDGVFAPVWTALFVLMAVAAWRVWTRSRFKGARLAFLLFGLQLVLNVIWSVLFFGLRLPGAALLEILLLWTTILITVLAFRAHSIIAALLLMPYLAWVGFAIYLNYGIWKLNS